VDELRETHAANHPSQQSTVTTPDMTIHQTPVQCERCGSTDTEHTHTAGVLRCHECGTYFEDEEPQMVTRRYHFDDDE
jgi:ribosomal protein S27E